MNLGCRAAQQLEVASGRQIGERSFQRVEFKMSRSGGYADMIVCLDIAKVGTGEYSFTVTMRGEMLYESAGCNSIQQAILEAVDVEPEFLGVQVAYQTLVAGTYAPDELRSGVNEVADLCVLNAAKFNQ